MKRIHFHISEMQVAKLQAESKKSGLSVAELVRRAIDAFFAEKKK